MFVYANFDVCHMRKREWESGDFDGNQQMGCIFGLWFAVQSNNIHLIGVFSFVFFFSYWFLDIAQLFHSYLWIVKMHSWCFFSSLTTTSLYSDLTLWVVRVFLFVFFFIETSSALNGKNRLQLHIKWLNGIINVAFIN